MIFSEWPLPVSNTRVNYQDEYLKVFHLIIYLFREKNTCMFLTPVKKDCIINLSTRKRYSYWPCVKEIKQRSENMHHITTMRFKRVIVTVASAYSGR